ncbi:MAG: hypothetical protein GF329_19700 [Candidatus Lokiarchaeota archaeon]|nr:hypothetical protein [Candidatus Lokiarchaeota archaeon]
MKLRINLKNYRIYVEIIALILVFSALYLTSLYNYQTHEYLLFHTLAEIFSIIIACTVFVVAYNSRRFSNSDYFFFLGTSFLFIGLIDLIHTLAYKGMNIFTDYTANLPTQLWIFARYFQAITFLISIFLINRKINMKVVFSSFAIITTLFISLIFIGLFPDCFIPCYGLTLFKIVSEYIIIIILGFAILILYKKRNQFDTKVFRMLILAIVFIMAAEFSFTFYIDVYGISNLIGHFFKILSFYMIYKALITKSLIDPYNTLFRDLKESQRGLIEERNQILDSYEELESKITTVNNGFLMVNKNGKIIQMDSTYEEIYSNIYGEKVSTGQNIFKLSENELNKNIIELFSQRNEMNKMIEVENGKTIELSASIAEDQDDSSFNILIIIYDLSNIVQRGLLGKKLISTVSHQLKNPIQIIKIAINNLNNYETRLSDDQKKSIINMISKNSRLMEELVEDLLVVSSDGIHKKDLNRKRINLLDMVKNTLSEMKLLLEEKEISIDLKSVSNIELYVDPLKISQIFRILIDNAIKYSYKNSIIKFELIDNYKGKYNPSSVDGILVSVIDSGRGIKETDQKNIFKKFFRSDDVEDIKGTGLGLSIAKEFARLHNGDIYVESQYKKGSKFSVFIPKE